VRERDRDRERERTRAGEPFDDAHTCAQKKSDDDGKNQDEIFVSFE